MTYSTDSHPHCEVAQDDDGQRNQAACDHENDHIGLNSRVLAAAEYIRTTGSLQSMGPIPGWRKTFRLRFHC